MPQAQQQLVVSMLKYTPSKWYWIVAGSTTQVYSSATGNYVPVANAGYIAWLVAGNLPTRIASEAELGEVLAQYGLVPIPAAILDTYKGALADRLQTKLLAKLLFNHENRIRALEGLGSITAAQFRNALKNMVD